jgi:hypothetical protein
MFIDSWYIKIQRFKINKISERLILPILILTFTIEFFFLLLIKFLRIILDLKMFISNNFCIFNISIHYIKENDRKQIIDAPTPLEGGNFFISSPAYDSTSLGLSTDIWIGMPNYLADPQLRMLISES